VGARLDEARRTFTQLVRLDPGLEEASKQLDEAFYSLQELGRQMGEYASRVEDDPARLDQVRRRQDLLFRLKARYGPTLAEVVAAGRAARAELDELGASTLDESRLRTQLDAARQEHARLAADLSAKRRKGAKRLDTEVNRLLPELAMPGGRFVTVLEPLDAPGAYGAESVEFRVAANPGFEPGPLDRVASGGELSRIMLALKAILARHDRLASLIFDEIDAGIGGAAALVVAQRLRDVAREHQVFVVTHLPQIAAAADHHLHVEKEERGGRASTAVNVLGEEQRVGEIARMLGGEAGSGTGRAHARELLERRGG
jgi:DNA repair protein RecN (Recombination protein N)